MTTAGTVRVVGTAAEARSLAGELNGVARRRPVIVITAASGQPGPYVDADSVASEVGGFAEVTVLGSAEASWEFSAAMPPDTQVYGGAARVYPVGTAWVTDLRAAPLLFVYGKDAADRVQEELVERALTLAHRAGGPAPARATGRRAAGRVTGVIGSRALVEVDGGKLLPATARPELTVPGVPAERLFQPGMTVGGVWEPVENRIDVTPSLVSAADNLRALLAARAVLVRIGHVERRHVLVELVPGKQAKVAREEVPGEPVDLRALFTEGDVVEALVEGEGVDPTRWQVWLGGLCEDERASAFAPSLLPGGPPWLVATAPEPAAEDPAPETPLPSTTGVTPSDLVEAAGGNPLALERDTLAHRLTVLTAELEHAQDQLRGARSRLRRSQERAADAERRLQSLESRVRPPGTRLFDDAEEQLRFDVHVRWAELTTPGEKRSLAQRPFTLGAEFLTSLADLRDEHYDKVVSVIVEIITDRVWSSEARQVHQLRTGDGGEDPPVTRADGATCWRVYLQHKTPQARRLHFWQLTDRVELSSVRLHDDMRP